MIVLPAIALSASVLAFEWKCRPKQLPFLARQWAIFFGVWLVALGILALPLLLRPDVFIVTIGNNDIVHHAGISRFLMEQGRGNPAGFVAQYPYAFVWYADYTYFGYYSMVADVAALRGLMPHDVVSVLLACIAALHSGPVYLLARRGLRVSRPWAMFWSVLAVANALTLYILYDGFGGQIFGVYFSFALLCLLVCKQGVDWKTKRAFSHASVVGVAMIGLMLSYPHMLSFVLGIAGAWRLVEGVQNRNQRWLPAWIAGCLLGAVLCCAVIPNRIEAFYEWSRQVASMQSGWFVRFPWPDSLLGLIGTQMVQAYVAVIQPALRFAVLAGLAGLFLLLFSRRSRDWGRRLLPPLAAFGAIYACALFFAATDHTKMFGGYKAFKVLSYFSAMPAVLVAAAWFGLWQRDQIGRIGAGLFLAGYLAVWGVSVATMVRTDGRGSTLSREIGEQVAAVRRTTSFDSVNIVTDNFWESMWLVYFFLDKQVYLAFPSYYPPAGLGGQVSFVRGNSRFVSVKDAVAGLKSAFGLSFSPNRRLLACHRGLGWHGPERGHEWMGVSGSRKLGQVEC